jgi:DNA-binding beta-propeller fold protein YncE
VMRRAKPLWIVAVLTGILASMASAVRAQEPVSSDKQTHVTAAVDPPAGAADSRDAINLPSGKRLNANVPGDPRPLNSLPETMALSPDGRYVVTLNAGYGTDESRSHQSLAVLDLRTNRLQDFPDARLGPDAQQNYFVGLAFSRDGRRLFASISSITAPVASGKGEIGCGIAVYEFANGIIKPGPFWPMSLREADVGTIAASLNRRVDAGKLIPYPAGLAVMKSGGGERLVVADNLSDDAQVMDARSGRILQRFDLRTQKVVPGSYPYAVVCRTDGSICYVSLWNASRVAELKMTSGAVRRMIALRLPPDQTAAGSHPTAMLLDPKESRLYVALANTDEVAVVNTASGDVEKYFSAKLPGEANRGASPVALAQSADGKRLYVADAGANAVAILGVSGMDENKPPEMGFIPTEWYPLALGVVKGELLITTGKGPGTGPNSGKQEVKNRGRERAFPYTFSLLHGSIARVKLAEVERNLPAMTRAALVNNRTDENRFVLPFAGGKRGIHHVIYIIKENRTYDQLFGDIKEGNGDPSLAMYGEDITPNQHALARSFGILDNFYDSGEVSGDGHNWSTSATGSDYLEKTIQSAYRDNERTYDFEGEVANRIPLEDNMPDVNESGTGYLWSNAARHGLSYRHYGEFVLTRWCNAPASSGSSKRVTPEPVDPQCARKEVRYGEALPPNVGEPRGSPSPWPWPVPMIAQDVPTKPELRGHFDPRAADFETSYPDQLRVDEFLNEFEQFVDARKTGQGKTLPSYVLLRLPNDHTSGAKPGSAAPEAAVADNDLAVGRVVEAVSNSPYWDDTAVFILEDDAQNGPDHVDAHRSIALVVSRFSPSSPEKPRVDSYFYTTVSMIHTMEALLGLPAMNSNDAHAPLMASPFSGDGGHGAFHADYRNRDNGLIYKMNPPRGPGAKESAAMDFSHADQANSAELNQILWRERMGERPMPPPQHTVFAEQPGDTD